MEIIDEILIVVWIILAIVTPALADIFRLITDWNFWLVALVVVLALVFLVGLVQFCIALCMSVDSLF